MAGDENLEDEVTVKRTIRQSCMSYWMSFNSMYQVILLGLAVTMYLLIGASIFAALEAPTEEAQISARVTEQERLKEMVMMTFNATRGQVDSLFTNFSTACANNLLVTDTVRVWTYARAVFFSATVVTTIGESVATTPVAKDLVQYC